MENRAGTVVGNSENAGGWRVPSRWGRDRHIADLIGGDNEIHTRRAKTSARPAGGVNKVQVAGHQPVPLGGVLCRAAGLASGIPIGRDADVSSIGPDPAISGLAKSSRRGRGTEQGDKKFEHSEVGFHKALSWDRDGLIGEHGLRGTSGVAFHNAEVELGANITRNTGPCTK